MTPVINPIPAKNAEQALAELKVEIAQKLSQNPDDLTLKTYAEAIEKIGYVFNASGLAIAAQQA